MSKNEFLTSFTSFNLSRGHLYICVCSRARLKKEEVPIEIKEILKEGILYILFNTLRADFFQICPLKELKEVLDGQLAPHLT